MIGIGIPMIMVGQPPLWTGSLILGSVTGINAANPGTQSEYAAVSTIPALCNYAFNTGYHYFDIGAGTYNVSIQGAEGSGTAHGFGAKINAVLSVSAKTRMVAIVGNPGAGSYSGGGMTALALVNNATDVYTSPVAILVAGGGGGGYSVAQIDTDGGPTTASPTTRRGATTTEYDDGAAFYNSYAPIYYSNAAGTQGSVSAQHFVWGAMGGRQSACGGVYGGFGGGGGGCPAGGGGYYGGHCGYGSNSGGGGTSYMLSSGSIAFISSWSDNGTNGSTVNSNPGTARGSLSITLI
jgi:hypothetical protein